MKVLGGSRKQHYMATNDRKKSNNKKPYAQDKVAGVAKNPTKPKKVRIHMCFDMFDAHTCY